MLESVHHNRIHFMPISNQHLTEEFKKAMVNAVVNLLRHRQGKPPVDVYSDDYMRESIERACGQPTETPFQMPKAP